MNLLLQTIQEYLEDHHPNWKILKHTNPSYIINKTRHYPDIAINTTTQEITTHLTNKQYTPHTILQQLTETIHTLEQQTYHQ